MKKINKIIYLLILFAFLGVSMVSAESIGTETSYFQGLKPYRMWQGVATDGNYIYVSTDRNENFNLENIISVYTMDGGFVKEKRTAYTGKDSLDRFMSFGDLTVINGFLYAPVYNWNGGAAQTPDSRESRMVKYSLPDLEIAAEYPIGDGTAESVEEHNGHYWVIYHDKQEIHEFDENFQYLKSYNLSQSIMYNNTEMGPQGLFWEGDDLYVNAHGANEYGLFYALGLDHYKFDGEKFMFIERIKPPTYGAGQGIEKRNGKYYWSDRPGNRIVITNSLDSTIKSFSGKITKQDILRPQLLNGWQPFDSNYDRTATFYKDSNGIVHLQGIIKGGEMGDTNPMFVLPNGYRPKYSLNLVAVAGAQFARVAIIGNNSNSGSERSGEVIYSPAGDNSWISLDGLTFLADPDAEE